MKIRPLLLLLVACLLFQPLAHADPTITVRFCSSGFEIGIAPTDWGVIYVSTGFYSQEPLSAGECVPTYDPTTQIDRFYFVNSSDAYYIGQYYEYGAGNNTLVKSLEKVMRHVLPVFGQVEDGDVVFHTGRANYTVPVKEVLPYLWSNDMVKSLAAFPEGNGLIIVPTGIIDVVENNFTVLIKPGAKVGTTLLDLNFTYWTHYQYPFYVNGTVNGNFVWGNRKEEKGIVTWSELVKTFEKPLYVFYFNGSSIKPIPIMQVRISLEQGGLELSPKYSFENLASPYLLNGSTTSATSTNSSNNSTVSAYSPAPTQESPAQTAAEDSYRNNRENSFKTPLLLVVLGLSVMALIVCRRGTK